MKNGLYIHIILSVIIILALLHAVPNMGSADNGSVYSEEKMEPADIPNEHAGNAAGGEETESEVEPTVLRPSMVRKIRLMTFNMHSGRDLHGRYDLSGVINMIIKTGADIVVLQEVQQSHILSGMDDQPGIIAEAVGMNYVYGPAVTKPYGKYGNMILSRFPIINSRNLILKSMREDRGLLAAELDIGLAMLTVFGTHLGLDNRERLDHSMEIAGEILNTSGYKVLLGDLNERPEGDAVKYLKTILADPADREINEDHGGMGDTDDPGGNVGFDFQVEPERNTFPAGSPRVRIDYILVDKSISATAPVALMSEASDHLPVMVDITIKSEAAYWWESLKF